MDEQRRRFEVELDVLKREVEADEYSQFVALLKLGLEKMIEQGQSDPLSRLDKTHPLLAPILAKTSQAARIAHMVGFEDLDDRHMVLRNFDENLRNLLQLNDILTEELSEDFRVMDVEKAKRSIETGDSTIVIGNLAYFYYTRLMMSAVYVDRNYLIASPDSIQVAINMIELCQKKLRILQRGSDGHEAWENTKALLREYMSVHVILSADALLQQFEKTGDLIAFELNLRYSRNHCDFMRYMKAMMELCTSGFSSPYHMVSDHMVSYVEASKRLPRDHLGQSYMRSVEKVKEICLEGRGRFLDVPEVGSLGELIQWQLRNFLNQLSLPSLRLNDDFFESNERNESDDQFMRIMMQLRQRLRSSDNPHVTMRTVTKVVIPDSVQNARNIIISLASVRRREGEEEKEEKMDKEKDEYDDDDDVINLKQSEREKIDEELSSDDVRQCDDVNDDVTNLKKRDENLFDDVRQCDDVKDDDVINLSSDDVRQSDDVKDDDVINLKQSERDEELSSDDVINLLDERASEYECAVKERSDLERALADAPSIVYAALMEALIEKEKVVETLRVEIKRLRLLSNRLQQKSVGLEKLDGELVKVLLETIVRDHVDENHMLGLLMKATLRDLAPEEILLKLSRKQRIFIASGKATRQQILEQMNR